MTAGILFVLAMVLGISFRDVTGIPSSTPTDLGSSTNSSVSAYNDSSSPYLYYDPHPDYPDCNISYASWYIGDGLCDSYLNIASCGWDGGDCCLCTCNSSTYYGCDYLYDDNYCEDPSAPLYLGDAGCQNASLRSPEGSRCPQSQVELVVDSTASAMTLAKAIMSSEGNFTVEWRGNVDINTPIYIVNGTHLNITGVSDAVADGGGAVQIFIVYAGFLYLNNIRIIDGSGLDGGAIILAADSNLFADNVTFNSNNAQNVGGAIFAETSVIELLSTTFNGNSARHEGAVFVHNSDVVGSGNVGFIHNSASENGGALYIMEGSTIEWNFRRVFTKVTLESISSGFYYYGSYWTVIDESGVTTFFNNTAGGSGGAMYVDASYIYGGAIGATEDAWVYFTVNASTIFTNDKCRGNGGAGNLLNSYIHVEGNVTFSHNSAVTFGGALYASQIDYGPTLTGVTFVGNYAASGGAVFFSALGTNLYLSSGSIYESLAVYASTFIWCRFDSNSASSIGGAIHSTVGSDHVQDTIFVNNLADIGGAMRVSGVVDLFNSSFVDNISGDGGGPAVSNGGYISKMVGLIFSGNSYYCSSNEFVDAREINDGGYRYDIICDGCDTECEGCTIEDTRYRFAQRCLTTLRMRVA